MWDLVGNPEDRFSQNEAHFKTHSLKTEKSRGGATPSDAGDSLKRRFSIIYTEFFKRGGRENLLRT